MNTNLLYFWRVKVDGKIYKDVFSDYWLELTLDKLEQEGVPKDSVEIVRTKHLLYPLEDLINMKVTIETVYEPRTYTKKDGTQGTATDVVLVNKTYKQNGDAILNRYLASVHNNRIDRNTLLALQQDKAECDAIMYFDTYESNGRCYQNCNLYKLSRIV